ncbi:MAG: pyrroline-5-carboxylate reductase [Candidatus Woesearchaeota archaeon]
MKIGIIGTGKMGKAILESVLGIEKPEDLFINDKNLDYAKQIGEELKVSVVDIKQMIEKCDTLIIAVKPQDLEELSQQIGNIADKLIISIMAGIKISVLKEKLKSDKIIRVMPNLCCLVKEASSAYTCSEDVSEYDIENAERILSSFGSVIKVEEELIDAVTGLSGSGPAYVAKFVKSLSNAGINQGLSEEQAYRLALQTVFGTGKLLKEGKIKADELIEMVSSKKGTTEAGMNVLNDSDFDEIIMRTVSEATERSKELGKNE